MKKLSKLQLGVGGFLLGLVTVGWFLLVMGPLKLSRVKVVSLNVREIPFGFTLYCCSSNVAYPEFSVILDSGKRIVEFDQAIFDNGDRREKFQLIPIHDQTLAYEWPFLGTDFQDLSKEALAEIVEIKQGDVFWLVGSEQKVLFSTKEASLALLLGERE